METRHYKKTLSRRRFLGLAAGAMALVGTGAAFGKAALLNPGRPAALALKDSPWVRNIWHDLDPHEVWDGHVHLAGIGDANSGIVLGEGLNSPCRHPWQYLQRQFYMNASCPERTCAASADEGFALRLEEQMRALPGGVKALLLAFDFFHDEKGLPVREKSAFYVPDAYACRLARANPERFAWAASIHPYRPDAVDRLHAAAAQGAKAVKWLPAAQNIDPASPRCKAFYAALARLRLPLLTHCGEESAVQGADMQRFGNPLRLRRALEAGVRVLAAHCALRGQDEDLDHGGTQVESFALFTRLMDDPAWQGLLFGDISAVTLINKKTRHLQTLLERHDWHERLINGSDYPLPGIIPLVSLRKLSWAGLLPEESIPDLRILREHNPILFDLALKRALSWQGRRFAPSVFATRSFFTGA